MLCSEASCLTKDRPGLVREGYSQLDYSLQNLRTKPFICASAMPTAKETNKKLKPHSKQ